MKNAPLVAYNIGPLIAVKELVTAMIRLVFASFVLVFLAQSATAQNRNDATVGVVATVNGEAITGLDLEMRIRLVALTSRQRYSEEVRKRLSAQVLRSLITERLQLQEARRLNIKVSSKEITDAVLRLEQNNRMPRGRLFRILRQQGINPQTLVEQIRAALAWRQVVRRVMQARVQVSQQEVDEVLERLSKDKNRLQYRLSEIYIPVLSSSQEETAAKSAQRILGQIRRGAPFGALAREFSQSSTAARGGDMGLVFEGQLPKALDEALKNVRTGQVIGPIRAGGGYYILWVRDRGTMSKGNTDKNVLTLVRAVFPVGRASNRTAAAAYRAAQKANAESKTCRAFVGNAQKAGGRGVQLQSAVVPTRLPPLVRARVMATKTGQLSRPIVAPNAVLVYRRCTTVAPGLPTAAAVRQSLIRQKLNAQVQGYLRDLQRAAFIDIRA